MAPWGFRQEVSELRVADVAQFGPYFVSVCAHNRSCLFGEIADLSACGHAQAGGQMVLNDAGRAVK